MRRGVNGSAGAGGRPEVVSGSPPAAEGVAQAWPTGASAYWERLIDGEERGLVAAAARGALAGAAALYGLGVAANRLVYECGLLQRKRVPLPVVSVGNLTLGGSGKTTVAAFLAVEALERGRRPAIVSRGHGREQREPTIWMPGQEISISQVGDEPLMIARRLGRCAIGVGKWREQVISELHARGAADVAILDDGAQYFRLDRDAEILLLDATQQHEQERLFPAGRLREPLSQLRRAHLLMVTHADQVSEGRLAGLAALARRYSRGVPVVYSAHRLNGLRRLEDRSGAELRDLADKRVLAVSAVGNPRSFETSLASAGAQVVPHRLPDHHSYVPEDLVEAEQRAEGENCDLIVTTEKDAVKIEGLEPGRQWWAVGCELEVEAGGEHLEALWKDVLHRDEVES